MLADYREYEAEWSSGRAGAENLIRRGRSVKRCGEEAVEGGWRRKYGMYGREGDVDARATQVLHEETPCHEGSLEEKWMHERLDVTGWWRVGMERKRGEQSSLRVTSLNVCHPLAVTQSVAMPSDAFVWLLLLRQSRLKLALVGLLGAESFDNQSNNQ